MKSVLSFVFVFTMLFGGCPQNNPVSNCDTEGTVKDYTGLDGCKLLIELADGTKFQPVEVANDFTLLADQKIKFGYEEVEGMASICMAGKMIKVTCVEEVAAPPKPVDPCTDIPEDPEKITWMADFIKQHKTEQLLTYEKDGKRYYFFKILRCCDFQSFVKDCEGNAVCTDGGITGGDCHPIWKEIGDDAMTVIWEAASNPSNK